MFIHSYHATLGSQLDTTEHNIINLFDFVFSCLKANAIIVDQDEWTAVDGRFCGNQISFWCL